jgi:PAS domain S-box/PAS domain S-box/PAS domain S-box
MVSGEIVSNLVCSRSRWADALRLGVLALAYFGAHQISFLFPDTTKILMAIWPAGGIGLAALLLCPRRLWPAILGTLFVAGYSADLLAGRPVISSLGFMTANVLESLSCAWFMTTWCGEGIRFVRIKDIAALVLAATVVNACTACLGAGAAALTHAARFGEFWLMWWISDGLGILLVGPVIVTLSKAEGPFWGVRPKRAIEWLLFMAVWVGAAWATFEPRFINIPPHPYMLVVILAWPALRLGQRTVSLALLILAVMAVVSKTVAVGPSIWGGPTLLSRLLDIQVFLGFTGTMGYLLAASYAEVRVLLDSLHQSEQRFRVIASGSPDHVIVQDRSLRYTFVLNPQLGLTEKDMIGKTDHEFLSRADADNLTAIKRRVLESENPVHVEIPLVSKNGNEEYFDGAYVPRRATDGTVDGLIGYFRNVTEARRMERALRDSENSYRTLVEQASEAIFIADAKGDYIDANARACAMVGYTREELLRLNLRELLLSEDLAAMPVRFSELQAGRPVLSERRMRRKDGSVFFAEISGKRLADGRYQGIVRDVSERKQMQETLRQSEEKYRNLFNNAEVGMFRTRLDGSEILDFNEKYLEIFGRTRDEMKGSATIMHWADAAERAALVKKLEADGRVKDFECRMVAKDGAVKTCLTSVRVYPEQGILEGSLIDISDWKRAEAERLKLEQQIGRSQRLESLGLLAGGIAHDFNNLMSGIYGNIELALDGPLDKDSAALLSRAMASMGRARDLTRQLLTFAKGGAPVRAVGRLFPFVEESARFALSGGQVTCAFDVAPDLWACNFDKNQIGQVIDNLVINGKQAMSGGGALRISARNARLREHEAAALPAGDYVVVSVEDTGAGIPAEVLSKIFDPFYTTKEQGRGLGLSTCHSIMRRHEGAITAESTVGQGSTFRLYLPATRAPSSGDAQEKPAARRGGGGRVLVMDDEKAVLHIFVGMLTSLGYSVETVADGDAAVELFASERKAGRPFCAAILDLTIPGGMGGQEAGQALRALDGDVQLFVTSGYAEDPAMAAPAAHGFRASLRKPFSRAELSELLEVHVRRS